MPSRGADPFGRISRQDAETQRRICRGPRRPALRVLAAWRETWLGPISGKDAHDREGGIVHPRPGSHPEASRAHLSRRGDRAGGGDPRGGPTPSPVMVAPKAALLDPLLSGAVWSRSALPRRTSHRHRPGGHRRSSERACLDESTAASGPMPAPSPSRVPSSSPMVIHLGPGALE